MKTTALVTTILVITLAIYDLVVVSFWGVEVSVSRFLQSTAFKAPFVPFGIGFICGHLFGYMPPRSDSDG